MSDIAWIIEAGGESRFRRRPDGSIETQKRETLLCNFCDGAVLTWPGEHARHWPMVRHSGGCPAAGRSI
ncbi:hypothetical protein SEA_FUZZBUSTER_55 [Microbacterium phage FuzzBuster]|uniref:Uncharacterized protein n=1 Tax=Microbacterium phage FuzzBuster TaxID=2590935 RepID=A0A516KV26_9CAUD|nr:hypothetical protein SEA_FUZZBUSTER_55 [Microbacterium phage FuzzBuster]